MPEVTGQLPSCPDSCWLSVGTADPPQCPEPSLQLESMWVHPSETGLSLQPLVNQDGGDAGADQGVRSPESPELGLAI